jgi:hypothetical protein
MATPPEINVARQFTANAPNLLQRSQAFRSLHPATQQALLRDLKKINQTLGTSMTRLASDPYAFSLDTPDDFNRHRRFPGQSDDSNASSTGSPDGSGQPTTIPAKSGAADSQTGPSVAGPKSAATQTLARRTGALSDEINFPAFVAALVHGTFDAIVDATIRQMEAFADLVSAVAKDVDQFTNDNVTPNQAKDWLAKQYPQDLQVTFDNGQPNLQPKGDPNSIDNAPSWLSEYGLDGQLLNTDLIDQQLVPMARKRVGQNRLQTLATMVLLGMNRVVVRDGTISARIQIRAQADDKAKVDYAVSSDPGGQTWGDRGSSTYSQPGLMVSTVNANVQTDTNLQADLYGEVRINFASETLPLERFADPARLALLQRNTRSVAAASLGATAQPSTSPVSLPTPVFTPTAPVQPAFGAVAPATAPGTAPTTGPGEAQSPAGTGAAATPPQRPNEGRPNR